MRQAGIVAAAGLYALDHNVERLADDHARARRLAEGWAAAGLAGRPRARRDELRAGRRARARASTSTMRSRGSRDAGRRCCRRRSRAILRAVTHLDVDDDDVERALELRFRARSGRVYVPEHRSRSTGCSRSGRPTGCRRSPPRSSGRARSSGRTRSARPTTTPARDATPDTQYRIGSITKTFTADGDHAAPRRGRARPRRPARAAPRRDRERLADAPPDALRTSRACSARRGRCSSTATSPTEERARRVDERRRVRARRRRRRTTTRTSPSRCSGRSSRARAACRTRRTSTSAFIGPLGLERTTWTPQRAEGAGLPRRRVRAHRAGRSRRPTSAAPPPMGQLWSTVEDLAPLGDVPRRRAPTACSTRDGRGDVVPAGHVLPRRLGARLGARPDALQPATGRSSAATAAPWPGHLAGVYVNRKTRDRRRRADELGHARRDGAARDRARREGARAVAGADRAVAARARSRRPTSRALLGAGGRRATSSSSGGRRARCRRRSPARRRGRGRDGVRARRRRLARRRRAASAASGCASTDEQLVWVGLRLHARRRSRFKA